MNSMDKLNTLEFQTQKVEMNFQGSIFIIDNIYEPYDTIGRGAYGVVVAARNKKKKEDEEKVAIKKIENIFEHSIFTKRCLRELKIMRLLNHPNILKINHILLPESPDFKDIYVVYELMDTDLSSVISSDQPLCESVIKYLIYQLLKGIDYMHSVNVIHRDIKPRNILINANCQLKICDFGLARYLFDDYKHNFLTNYIATRWYRPPEVLLSWHKYDKSVDIWSVGCIFAEMFLRKPLFQGDSIENQMGLIIDMLGTPSDDLLSSLGLKNPAETKKKFSYYNKEKKNLNEIFNGVDPNAIDLIDKMLQFNYKDRISEKEALAHQYFSEIRIQMNDEFETNIEPLGEEEFYYEKINADDPKIKQMIVDEILIYHQDKLNEVSK